jgi:lipopolysaccharide/colanic/teichoic acid biosynthesis glycosyltransferase
MKANWAYESVKRMADVIVSALLLVCLSPVCLCVAVLVALADRRPVVFGQERIGRHDSHIKVLKFRTMRVPRVGEEGPEYDSARITRMGRFLRASSLDELPTLWNVLKGDMSLVGPRPLPVRYLERYSPTQRRRHEVRPGVTGWAQVHGRNSLEWEEKFAYDVWYVDHRSLKLDSHILAMTLSQVVRREGISYEGHSTMPEFFGRSDVPLDPLHRDGNGSGS